MTREEEREQAALQYVEGEPEGAQKLVGKVAFEFGAKWADEHPRTDIKGCTILTDAPELSATTVANNCYTNMLSMKRTKFRIDVDSQAFVTMVAVFLGLLIVFLVSGIIWLLKHSPFHPLVTFSAICLLAIAILIILSIRKEK